MTVELAIVPTEQTHLLVIGTSLRKSRTILEAYLKALDWQILPRNVNPYYLFVDDGLEPDAKTLVEEFLKFHNGQLVASTEPPTADFSDQHPVTHQWSSEAMNRVGRNKDYILGFANHHRAEAVWFCDSDLICDPMTLMSLWSVPEPVVCAVYWTRWQKTASEQDPVHAGPQVWQRHPYDLNGNGMDEWELRRRLINRDLVEVHGQGACTLIKRGALEKVSFSPVPGNTGPGLMQGEDRHFCIRATLQHIRMMADGWPDIFHIYHRPEDEALIPEMLGRLNRQVPDTEDPWVNCPKLGDLVSLELTCMERILTGHGPVYPPTQLVRGRLGKLGLHAELEQVVLEMERDETRIVPTHFGLDYPLDQYRGKRRLIKMRLIDHKPMGFPPVVDQEIIKNDAGSWVDTTTLPPETITLMREIHAPA